MGGFIVAHVVSAVITTAMFSKGVLNASNWDTNWGIRFAYAVVPIAVGAWQAWLLFRKYPIRFACWTAVPMLTVLFPMRAMGYAGLVSPLIGAAILRGARKRAWAWILACMAGVVLKQAWIWFIYVGGGQQMIDSLLNQTLGDASPVLALIKRDRGVIRGVSLLSVAIPAAVLAWKMPPVNPLSRPVQPDEKPPT